MIYLDNNATTRIDPLVLDTMMPFLTDTFANASSTHPFGLSASEAVKVARQQVATLLGAKPNEIVFTSGATEAINTAIKGVAENYAGKGKHIITVQTEHSAVLDVCKYLETKGFEVTYLPVLPNGLVTPESLQKALRTDTILVAIMTVNNEIGVIQPIRKLAELTHAAGALFMTDATQAVGKMPLNVHELDVDLLACSAHKFYGPKGVGALYVRQRRVKLEALLHGGGHEGGRRSGTLNVAGIVGMGKAAELADNLLMTDTERVGRLRDTLEKELLTIEGTRVNGSSEHRLYNITNILFEGCDSEALIMGLDNIAVSNGSACTSASLEPSHVLTALGLTETEAFSCLRFSLGRFTTAEEIPQVVQAVKQVVESLRAMVG
ncbi:cysteine desulfurase family protein [Arundinibacter roseus]|uniref:cysteine desulfurase n=1 Tax=Arundinibacter roseus TaxID=2070510 RepID=A0A4R4K018_9BACT|nr:cysteine desulfurase family protein [Arundinibacter roseus]TDB60403.1 cysteine desulfurase [Arundinibacter roseus]